MGFFIVEEDPIFLSKILWAYEAKLSKLETSLDKINPYLFKEGRFEQKLMFRRFRRTIT